MGDAAAAAPKREQVAGSCSSYAARDRGQSRLHNFSFPSVSWGSRRLLRCSRIDPPAAGSTQEKGSSEPWRDGSASSPPADLKATNQAAAPADDEEEEDDLARFRDAMMSEFQKALGSIQIASSLKTPAAGCKEIRNMPPPPPSAAAEGVRPWNLRLRRAACNAPAAAMANCRPHKAKKASPNKHQIPVVQENAAGGGRSEAAMAAEAKERPKFSQTLSKTEIEDDFLAVIGSKRPRRPKKRPRSIQKQIETIYPGLYLCEITPELYRTSQEK